MEQEVTRRKAAKLGAHHPATIMSVLNLCCSLNDHRMFDEAMPMLTEYIPHARRVLGDAHEATTSMVETRTFVLIALEEINGVQEAVTVLEQEIRMRRRKFGPQHPLTQRGEARLGHARRVLARLR